METDFGPLPWLHALLLPEFPPFSDCMLFSKYEAEFVMLRMVFACQGTRIRSPPEVARF